MSKTKTSRTKRTKASDDGLNVDPRLMKALSHPLRQRILQELNKRVGSPAELSEELGESLGNVSYHVKILAELEAIELVRTAPVRGALEHFYRPLVRPYFGEQHWAELPGSVRKDLFGQTIQQIWDHLAEAANEDKLDGENEATAWVGLELDEQGVKELNNAVDELLERASEIQSEAASRLAEVADDERETKRTELAVMHFHRASKARADASRSSAKKRTKP